MNPQIKTIVSDKSTTYITAVTIVSQQEYYDNPKINKALNDENQAYTYICWMNPILFLFFSYKDEFKLFNQVKQETWN